MTATRDDTKERLRAEISKIFAWCSERKTPAETLPLYLDEASLLPWYSKCMEELRGQYDGLRFSLTNRCFQTVMDSLASLQSSAVEYDAAIERNDFDEAKSILESVGKVCQAAMDAIDGLRKTGL